MIPCPYGCNQRFGLSRKLSLHVEATHPRPETTMADTVQLKEARKSDWRDGQALLRLRQLDLLRLFEKVCKSTNMEMLNKTVMDDAGLENFDHTATNFYHSMNKQKTTTTTNFYPADNTRRDNSGETGATQEARSQGVTPHLNHRILCALKTWRPIALMPPI